MLVVADARAEECTPETRRAHRLSLGAGYSGVYFNGGTDGYYNVEGQRPSGHLGYAYSPERGLEVGADLVIFSGPIFLPAGMIRGYVSIGARDIVELGLSWHVGALVASSGSRTWTGWGTWLGVDVRVWATERVGFQLAGHALVARGKKPTDDSSPPNPYLGDLGVLAAGGILSVFLSL